MIAFPSGELLGNFADRVVCGAFQPLLPLTDTVLHESDAYYPHIILFIKSLPPIEVIA